MIKGSRLVKIISLIVLAALIQGCGISPKDDNKAASTKDSSSSLTVTVQEDLEIKKVVGDYFKKLYSDTVENYSPNSSSGIIPANIKDFLAKRTLDEGDNNPEIGIHLPRYIEINGLTSIGYELSYQKDKDNNDIADIESACIEKKDNDYMYFAKVVLKASCLPDELFDTVFKQNPVTKAYEKSGVVDENNIDNIKLQAKYDLEIVKEDNKFKILSATEANIKPGYQNRIFKFNNEFVERLPYLNIDKAADGRTYINKADGDTYEKEKAVIETFFNYIRNIDSGRMNLLSIRWNRGLADFKSFMDMLGISKNKDSKEIMAIGDDYKTRFDLVSFPLQVNMDKIQKYSNFKTLPHPAYTGKQKKYIVTFQGSIEKTNGIVGSEALYNYDYFVTLSGTAESPVISSIKLNEYYAVDTKK